MQPTPIDFPSLYHLLKCDKRSLAEDIIEKCFQYRLQEFPREQIRAYKETLKLTEDAVSSLLSAITSLIRMVLFYQLSTVESIAGLFPTEFHPQLRTLLSTILSLNYTEWSEATLSNQLSLPRFQSLDWNIHLKASHTGTTSVTAPTAMVKIQVEKMEDPSSSDFVEFEMGRETLQAMLEGLGKIRDQLQSVANAE